VEKKKKVFSVFLFLFLRMGGRFNVVKIRYFSVNKKCIASEGEKVPDCPVR
jgi:hypothetical protein